MFTLTLGVSGSIVSHFYAQHILGILGENGTCTDGIQKKVPSQILDSNGLNGSFKNLTSDNRQLAEIICQNLLNGNATINISPSNHS
jgi:hypothetical protein